MKHTALRPVPEPHPLGTERWRAALNELCSESDCQAFAADRWPRTGSPPAQTQTRAPSLATVQSNNPATHSTHPPHEPAPKPTPNGTNSNSLSPQTRSRPSPHPLKQISTPNSVSFRSAV